MHIFFKKYIQFLSVLFLTFIIISITIFELPQLVNVSEIPKGDFSEIIKSDIIIAGDSRAERQVNPKTLYQLSNHSSINIAQSAHDLYAVSKIFRALDLQNKTIIISASCWQMNDGSIKIGYFRNESFSDLNLIDKFKLYKSDIVELYHMQVNRFLKVLLYRTSIRDFYNSNRKINDGFEKVDCKTFPVPSDNFFSNHPFYKNPNFFGVKKKLIIKALENLSKLKSCNVLIYNGPVSSKFRKSAQLNHIYEIEKIYDKEMYSAISIYKNIKYISFLDDPTFEDNMFYDPQHLCANGAEIFTKRLLKELSIFNN